MASIVWWCVTALALFGAWLNARRRWQGFVIWFGTDVAMCARCIVHGDWPQGALWFAYAGLCVVGLWTWRKKEEKA